MPFIRLSDDYIDNPKFMALSASAFRLWHEGLAYCRRHQTDGFLAKKVVEGFRYFKGPRVSELTTAHQDGANPLWHIENGGYRVHDYLAWNPSKAEEDAEREGAKKRMRRWRDRSNVVGSPSVTASPTPERDAFVPGRVGITTGSEVLQEREPERKPGDPELPTVEWRAGQLLQNYQRWYAEERRGARLRLIGNSIEFGEALTIVQTWPDDAHIEKLARIVLTANEKFLNSTDRSFRIFAMKATWADDRLRAWEESQGRTA